VLDAVFPAADNPFFFPELIKEEGLQPHKPREVWVSLTSNPTVTLDVTDTWEIKVRALKEHKSRSAIPRLSRNACGRASRKEARKKMNIMRKNSA